MSQTHDILRLIDHAVLGPALSEQEVLAGVATAIRHQVAACFVLPCWLPLVALRLREAGVAPGTTVGFPLGQHCTGTKTVEAYDAIMAGADELDVVINFAALRSGRDDFVREDLAAVVTTCGYAGERRGANPVVLKAILETCYLTEAEKRRAVRLAVEAGVNFVKTSTGMGPGGATVEDVRLLRELAPPSVGVKAAGGLRTLADCRAMLEAGANRLGTSATDALARELQASP